MNKTSSIIVVAVVAVVTSACGKRVPEAAGIAPGTPHVTWVFMHGDDDNPDREFICQSGPGSECVVPASRPDARVFSNLHFYYHGAGAETKYVGTINIGFLQGSAASHTSQTNITVQKADSITNQSIHGIVTATPGRYTVALSLEATMTDTRKTVPIRESIPVTVR
jgi:hypothetical protein